MPPVENSRSPQFSGQNFIFLSLLGLIYSAVLGPYLFGACECCKTYAQKALFCMQLRPLIFSHFYAIIYA